MLIVLFFLWMFLSLVPTAGIRGRTTDNHSAALFGFEHPLRLFVILKKLELLILGRVPLILFDIGDWAFNSPFRRTIEIDAALGEHQPKAIGMAF